MDLTNRQLVLSSIAAVSLILPASNAMSTPSSTEIRTGALTLEKTSEAFNQAARKAMPTVVSIRAVRHGVARIHPTIAPQFAAPNGVQGDEEADRPSVGLGSGVILRADGLILTNNHVVENADRVTVALDDHEKYKAKVLGTDPKTDLAIVKMLDLPSDLKLVPITFANSDQVEVGDWAIAIGSPFGLTHTVTSGIVSAKGRGQMGVYDIEDFIQTDAAINPGNSGGPLLNMKGEMIGLNSAIFSQTGGYMGIGFAISANLAHKVADELTHNGKVKRGWIGVIAQDLDPDLADFFKTPHKKGALISGMDPHGPAAKVLNVGDVVLTYNRQAVNGSSDLRAMVNQSQAGQNATLDVIRNSRHEQIHVPIQDSPRAGKQLQQAGQLARLPIANKAVFGLVVQDIPPELTTLLGVATGTGALVAQVEPGSPAFEAGIIPGDVILKANQTRIQTPKEFSRFTRKVGPKDLTVLYLQRGPITKIFVPIRIEEG